MSPHETRQPLNQPAQSWETLDEETDDEALPMMVVSSSFKSNDDLELALENETSDENDIGYDDDENEESIRAFYEEFQTRPPPMRHFSFSELSNESSPLLNPLKRMRKGTPPKFWFHRLWRWYIQCLNRRPVVTKSITAGVIVSLGDVVGQVMASSSSSAATSPYAFDVARLARFCSMGLFLQAPVTHYYYIALDHYLPPTPENPWTWVTFFKLFIDQTTFAPAFLFAVFLYLGFLEGDSWSVISAQLQDEYVSTMVANWKLWIPATLLNLAYVPPTLRVLYCNGIFFVWSIFLSMILNQEPPTNGR